MKADSTEPELKSGELAARLIESYRNDGSDAFPGEEV